MESHKKVIIHKPDFRGIKSFLKRKLERHQQREHQIHDTMSRACFQITCLHCKKVCYLKKIDF